jgi:hypothetical protein
MRSGIGRSRHIVIMMVVIDLAAPSRGGPALQGFR